MEAAGMTYTVSGDNSHVCIGDYVEVREELTGNSKGTVCAILSQKDPPRVRLINGDTGQVVRVINSEKIILQRIMNEDQYTENKENFNEQIMRNKVIPQTVQSFLNSEGGYLYIGVRDTGESNERLVGIDSDLSMIDSADRSNDHLCDVLKIKIMDTLDKYLSSEVSLGSLIRIEIVSIQNVQLVEVRMQRSPEPWFYRHIKNGRPKRFELHFDGKSTQRIIDDFYIRHGNKKKMLETHEEFYTYAKTRFQVKQLVAV